MDISVGDMRQSSAEKVSLVDTVQGQSSAFNMTNVKEARGEKTGVYIALALPTDQASAERWGFNDGPEHGNLQWYRNRSI